MKRISDQRGSVILPTLLIILIVVGVGGSYLSIAYNEFRQSHRNQDLQSAVNFAEAGVEEAMTAMRLKDWSNWTTVVTDHYYYSSDYSFGTGTGRSGSWTTFVSVIDESEPIVFSEGRVSSGSSVVRKQLRIDLEQKGLFVNGLTAKDTIDWSGNNVSVDSYNSNGRVTE